MPKRTRAPKNARRRTRRARPRVARSLVNRVHHFKRTFRLPQLNFSVGSTLMYAEQFDIGQLPQFTDFANLFEVYKVNAIKYELVPCQTGSDLNPTATTLFLPNILSVVDYTDATPPTGINELMQYTNLRRTKITRRHSRYFVPKVNNDVNGIAIANVKPTWMGFGAGIPMYGVKWGLDQPVNTAVNGFGIDRYVTFYFSCKNVK